MSRGKLGSANALFLAGVVASLAVGAAVGLGGYTFVYAKGASYMFDDPQACMNCHVMTEQYDGWTRSSHHAVATCNDCHTPHDFVGKYLTKMTNGYHHSTAFTSGDFAEPIRIKPHNLEITERSCRHCHAAVVDAIDARHAPGEGMSCVRCHWNVGHPK
ncbi:MAG: cytochrome c nitrite reductase small subunit [Deltaproteobacteria bacterium]|nr:cytochrome c nitrite reductase small subunit [Deltaproteobacteria bacterium]